MSTTPLTDAEVAAIRREFPELPDDYLEYLRTTGWGDTPSGHMVYSGPIKVGDIYRDSVNLPEIVLLGDDHQGYCLGYDRKGHVYGEVSDSGEWQASKNCKTFLVLLDGG